MKKIIRSLKKFVRRLMPGDTLVNYCWHLPIEAWYAIWHGFPGRRIQVIGVAGTKGKTTTAYFIAQLLEGLGKRVALYSTAAIRINGREELNTQKMTTPGRGFMQQLLLRAVKAQCEYAVLEVSSHGLKQFRLFGIPFTVVVWTNMMPDHLDYHKTADDYILSHQRMVGPRTRVVVLNGEDQYLKRLNTANVHTEVFGAAQDCAMRINNISASNGTTSFTVSYLSRTVPLTIPTLGTFNVYNTTAALGALRGIGVEITALRSLVAALVPAPGRMETIPGGKGYTVIVDYAHSPDSFEQVFQTIRPQTKGKLIVVTGACGDRDARVRPAMGRFLGKYADKVVLTNDDPYTEDPDQIVRGLLEGLTASPSMREGESYWVIMDRRAAIDKGISLAQPNDTVLVLGKGAEQWQVFKDKKIPWDDRQVVRDLLNTKTA